MRFRPWPASTSDSALACTELPTTKVEESRVAQRHERQTRWKVCLMDCFSAGVSYWSRIEERISGETLAAVDIAT